MPFLCSVTIFLSFSHCTLTVIQSGVATFKMMHNYCFFFITCFKIFLSLGTAAPHSFPLQSFPKKYPFVLVFSYGSFYNSKSLQRKAAAAAAAIGDLQTNSLINY